MDCAGDMIRIFLSSTGLRLLGMLFGFLIGVQLARGLGASGYGIYGLAMSIITMLSVPAEFGLPLLVTREVAAAHARSDTAQVSLVVRWATRTIIIFSLGIALVGIGAWVALSKDLDNLLLHSIIAGALLVVLIPLGNVFGAALRGVQQIVRGQVPEIVIRPALFSAFLYLAATLSPVPLTPVAAIGMQVAAAALSLVMAYGLLRAVAPAVDVSALRAGEGWLRSALPMALAGAMRVLQGNLSLILLGYLAAPADVGLFRAGTSTALLIAMPVSVSHVIAAPTFSRLHAIKDMVELQSYLRRTTRLTVACMFAFLLPFIATGEALLSYVFGPEFGESNAVIVIASVGTLIGASFGPAATLLNMVGEEKYVARSFAMSLLVLIGTTPPLILLAGIEGAAVANAVAFVLWSAMLWRRARKLLGVDSSVFSLPARILKGAQGG